MKNWRIWLGLLVSALFIWLALHQIKDWNAFFNSFRQIHYWVLVPTLAGYFVVLLCRAWRWQYILKSMSPVKYSSTLSGIFICYMANNILPLRAGELVRAVYLARKEKQRVSPVMATVVVERISDSLAVIFFLAVVMLFLDIPAEHQDLNQAIHKGGIGALVLALGLLFCLYIFYFWREPVLKMLGIMLKPMGEKIQERLLNELIKFSAGLSILGKPVRLFSVMMLSFLVWLVNLIPIWAVGAGFGVKLSFIDSLFLLILDAFAASIPAAPGFWGTFHLITQKGMAFLGVLNSEQALSFAIVLHSFYFFPTTIVGLVLLWREGYSIRGLKRETGRAEG